MRQPRNRKPRLAAATRPPEVTEPEATEPEPTTFTPYVLSPGGTLHVAGCFTAPAVSSPLDVDALRARLGRSLVLCPSCEPAPRWWLTFRGAPNT